MSMQDARGRRVRAVESTHPILVGSRPRLYWITPKRRRLRVGGVHLPR